MSQFGDNDTSRINWVDEQAMFDSVTWAVARERLAVFLALEGVYNEEATAEHALCAIFTGRADTWRPLRAGEFGKAIENIPAGSPLEINGRGEIRAGRTA